MILLDGHVVAQEIYQKLKKKLKGPFSRKPTLACIITGQNPASLAYVGRKAKMCHELGIESIVYHIEPKTTEELVKKIHELNSDPKIDGILVQLPLPGHIDLLTVLESVDPSKDVDGFHPLNAGKVLLQDDSALYPCTPYGIKVLLDHYKIQIDGAHVVIVGRSHIVGRPLVNLLLQNKPGFNATVTCCHSQTKNLKSLTLLADILISAIGKPHFITADMVREGACVVDVGTNKIADKTKQSGFKTVGDVDFETVSRKCSAITPVPGGVGPMTIAMLMSNTVQAFLSHRH